MIVGVDPRKSSRTAAAVDAATDAQVSSLRVEATVAGYRQLLCWARGFPRAPLGGRGCSVGEAGVGGGVTKRPVNARPAVEAGQGEGLGHLGLDPRRVRRGGLNEPQPGAVSDGAELGLGRRASTPAGRAG